jgi:hypothetical protein
MENMDRWSPGYREDDGGRAKAGFLDKKVDDCTTRAVAIATGLKYRDVLDLQIEADRRTSLPFLPFRTKSPEQLLMKWLGWEWTALRVQQGETRDVSHAPRTGRHILRMAHHWSAIVDGEIWDTWDPRLVTGIYGWWSGPGLKELPLITNDYEVAPGANVLVAQKAIGDREAQLGQAYAERTAAVKAAAESGMSLTKIGRLLGISQPAVSKILKGQTGKAGGKRR